jgi:ABC-2 type transport system permease protein
VVINLGLVQRTLRETLPTAATFALILGSIAALLAIGMTQVQERFMQRGFIPPPVRAFRNALLGIDGSDGTIADVAFSVALVHPIMLVPLIAHAIIVCTRVPAGEVERGTIDVLLGLPTSRWTLFRSETLGWLIGASIVLLSVVVGIFAGAQFIKPELQPSWSKLAIVLVNLAMVYFALGSIAMAASSFAERRGRAIIFVMVVSIASLLINFLQLQWEAAKDFAFLSVLEYYKPGRIMQSGAWPWRDLGTLGGITLVAWCVAGVQVSRRDMTSL